MANVDDILLDLVKRSRTRPPQIEDIVPIVKELGSNEVSLLFELHGKALILWKNWWSLEGSEY